jgi:hypothetical protein
MSGWDCEAYGPEIAHTGAVCFIAGELGKRVCASQDACHEVITAERQRVYSRISELAAHGDPVMEDVAGAIGSPGQILGGGDDGDER